MNIQRALISVYDKSNLIELATCLQAQNIELIASGGTASYLKERAFLVTSIESITNFPEMLEGRLKTLHPKVHGGILARRDRENHLQIIAEHHISLIDLVVVNLYPFEEVSSREGASREEIIEQIDIGGPALLRSAAKNYQSVIALHDPKQYADFCESLTTDTLTEDKRKYYSASVFARVSKYDSAISEYLSPTSGQTLNIKQISTLRYGENPQQQASLYKLENLPGAFDNFQQVQCSKGLSYNNWLDIEAVYSLLEEFEPEIPTCAIIKHNTPCGVAFGESVVEAYEYALDCDPVSAFGGIVGLNSVVDEELAGQLQKMFLEIILATDYTDAARDILASKKNLSLLTYSTDHSPQKDLKQYRSLFGNALLEQISDHSLIDKDNLQVVTELQPEQDDWLGLLFAFRVAKHVKSNAIVITNQNRTVGICGGQTSRVNAVRIALEEASDLCMGGILASDGFFPFADNIDLIARAKIKTIIQPGGSIKDQEVINACNKYGIAMVSTGVRHFKH